MTLNDFETKHIINETSKYKDKVIFYQRYADDAICVFKGNARQIDLFTKFLNDKHPKIKFKNEIEQDRKINYLDLTITRNSDKFQYSIYRKPTQSSQVIHASSHHPTSHKMAAFNSFIHRLKTVPMNEDDYNKELEIIKYIAADNGYDPTLLDKILHRKKNVRPNANREKRYVTLNYDNQLCHKFSNILKKRNYKISYRTTNKLESILNKKPQIKNKYETCGVYKIACNDCPKFYIGQTRRSFKTRFNEHLPKNKVTQTSNYAEHLINTNHNYSTIDENLQILHRYRNRITALENFEIYKAAKSVGNNLLNDKLNTQANALFDTIIRVNQESADRHVT